MSTYTPDSWIESQANGMCCDDAGYCDECGAHLDSGRCVCEEVSLEDEPVAFCATCDRTLAYVPSTGNCLGCSATAMASRALGYRPPEQREGYMAASLLYILQRLNPLFAPIAHEIAHNQQDRMET